MPFSSVMTPSVVWGWAPATDTHATRAKAERAFREEGKVLMSVSPGSNDHLHCRSGRAGAIEQNQETAAPALWRRVARGRRALQRVPSGTPDPAALRCKMPS